MRIFVLEEDGVLRCYGSPEEVVRQIEALDAAVTLRVVFDELARPRRIEWVQPNRSTHVGPLEFVANGEYVLVPDADPAPALVLNAIASATAIDPAAVAAIGSLKSRLQQRSSNP